MLSTESTFSNNTIEPNDTSDGNDYRARNPAEAIEYMDGADNHIFVHSDVDESSHGLTKEEYEDFIQSEVDVFDFCRYKGMVANVNALNEVLPKLDIATGMCTAMKSKASACLGALKKSRENSLAEPSVNDIRRAMRDLLFLYEGIALVLGAYDTNPDIPDYGESLIYPEAFRRLNKGRYQSTVFLKSGTMSDEGDYIDLDEDEKGFRFYNFFVYEGTLTTTIDPGKRIEFSYRPDQEYARQFHASSTVVRNGKVTEYGNDDLSMRLDLDETSPAGIALDIGRSKFDGEKLSRPGDLLGKTFSTISDAGSHEYNGFTADMCGQFTAFAEEIALKQYLFHKWRQDEINGHISPRLKSEVARKFGRDGIRIYQQ